VHGRPGPAHLPPAAGEKPEAKRKGAGTVAAGRGQRRGKTGIRLLLTTETTNERGRCSRVVVGRKGRDAGRGGQELPCSIG